MFLTILAFDRPITYVWGMNTWDKRRAEYKNFKKYYYHLSSDGWKEGRLFHTIEQYAYGMTVMGLVTLKYGIVIYDFSLMPNHFHIILKGNGKQCLDAFDYLRMKISSRLVKDGYPPLPDCYGFKLTPIDNESQMRINILYLDRNAYEKNLSVPGGHPWGTSNLHFSPLSKYIGGTRAKDMKLRKLEELTGTRTPIPPDWIFHPDLGLLPSCFADQSLFNRLFPTPKLYLTRLIKDYESFAKLGRRLEEDVDLSSEEISDIANSLVLGMFPGKTLRELTPDDKGNLCVALHNTYNLTPLIISKALVMPEYLVKQFLYAKDYGKQKR